MKQVINKIVSILLILCLTVGISTNLTGCSSKDSNITMGDWLTLIDSTFNMDSYSSETPYFDNITSDNTYFAAVQIAGDWGVVDTTSGDLKVDEIVSYRTACIMLANVSEICSITASEDDKVAAAQNSIITIKDYFLNKNIQLDEANKAVEAAYFLNSYCISPVFVRRLHRFCCCYKKPSDSHRIYFQ